MPSLVGTDVESGRKRRRPDADEEDGSASASSSASRAAPSAHAGNASLNVLGTSRVHSSWRSVLMSELAKPYAARLDAFVRAARARPAAAVFPPAPLVFSALELTPLDAVRVVILGQDPYHGLGQAHGLALSVPDGVAIPPSLRNILTEIASDIGGAGAPRARSGCLAGWARQGVLLLNAVLTVESGKANSHAAAGWETLTDSIIREVSRRCASVVFLLWGKPAQAKRKFVDCSKHLVLEAPHPSPLSAHRGFMGCRHFSKANAWLRDQGQKEIVWTHGGSAGTP